MRTGQDNTWTAGRVGSARRTKGIDGYLSADKEGDWRTMTEAASELGVTRHVIRRLIKDGVLPARHLVPGAPYQIRDSDLHTENVANALSGRKSPCHTSCPDQMSMFSDA